MTNLHATSLAWKFPHNGVTVNFNSTPLQGIGLEPQYFIGGVFPGPWAEFTLLLLSWESREVF